MINGCIRGLGIGNSREKTIPICPEKFGEEQNEGGLEIVSELDFEEAMAEAKELVETVIEQNNTSEARKLRRRLGKMERTWRALMRWMYTIAESSEGEDEGGSQEKRNGQYNEVMEETAEKNTPDPFIEKVENGHKCSEVIEETAVKNIPDPFIKLVLYGLPKQFPSAIVIQEIHRQIDCERLTLEKLNILFKKYECTIKCSQKENWVVKLPRFLGKRMLDAKYITIRNNEIFVREYTEVVQCYRCWRFGHFAARCRRAERCKVCAGFHSHSVCTVQALRCVNCTDAGAEERETLHSVSSHRCPLFRRRWREAKTSDRVCRDHDTSPCFGL